MTQLKQTDTHTQTHRHGLWLSLQYFEISTLKKCTLICGQVTGVLLSRKAYNLVKDANLEKVIGFSKLMEEHLFVGDE